MADPERERVGSGTILGSSKRRLAHCYIAILRIYSGLFHVIQKILYTYISLISNKGEKVDLSIPYSIKSNRAISFTYLLHCQCTMVPQSGQLQLVR